MRKAADLRAHLAERVPCLKKDPDKLLMFISAGSIGCRAGSLSFVWRYEIEITVTDFADHADTLVIPLLDWVWRNQPSLLQGEKADDLMRFQAELIDHEKADVQFKLPLTENVIVAKDGGKFVATHCAEPPLDDLAGPSPWRLFINGIEVQ